MQRTTRAVVALCLAFLASSGPAVGAEKPILRLATTTSTENSGLLEYLLPPFERLSGYQVHVIAVGTGKALRIAQAGDVDLVMVHARPAEEAFVRAGYGVERRELMYNDFVLVGPSGDPAGLGRARNIAEALRRIAAAKQRFVSRGDDSGTHKKELSLWSMAEIQPQGEWYVESGQGMGRVLQMAGELDAYTLTDRGTWLFIAGKNPLRILYQGDPPMFNPYTAIAVSPDLHPHVDIRGANLLIDWLASAEGQHLISEYRINGQQLFKPLVVPGD